MLECSNYHSLTSGILGNYYGNKINDAANENVGDHRANNSKSTASKSFELKTKIIGEYQLTIIY